MTDQDIRMANDWAGFYQARGFNPLPSRSDAKRPLCKFARWWDSPADADVFDRFPTTNIQVMTGRHWRLLVIDLDGEAANAEWNKLGTTPRTWITHSGAGGWHLWFRLPEGLADPLPKSFLWKGDGPHEAIERLCDHSLVMAPPSIHPKTRARYRFLDKAHSPAKLALPADCPGWVLRLRPVVAQPAPWSPAPTVDIPRRVATPSYRRFDRTEVLSAIPDKLALVRSWGVRVAGRPNQSGWAPCHAIDRQDSHPSAAVHADSGHYVDHGSGLRLSLFDLSIQLGIHRDFHEAVSNLGERYAH